MVTPVAPAVSPPKVRIHAFLTITEGFRAGGNYRSAAQGLIKVDGTFV
jgi:hypothetical protein